MANQGGRDLERMIIQEKLASSPFLAGASLPLEQVTSKRFRAGQIISDKPSGVSSVGMIVSGRVEVYSVALDGKDVQLNALTAGECFGVCNLMASAELETVLRCGEETEVLYIPKAVLLSCMEQDAGLAMRYAALCNRKLQFLLRRIELLTMQSCRGRVIAHLLAGQDRNGCVKPTGSREDLARQLGVSRAAVWKAVKQLESEGMCIQAATNRGYALSDAADILSPACISGYIRAIKPLAWQPGTATRGAFFTLAKPFSNNSGKPYCQPGSVRCAVEASITRVRSFSIRATASWAAASGRHKKAMSQLFSISFLAERSLRCSSFSVSRAISLRPAKRSKIRRPVVPSLPSIKT